MLPNFHVSQLFHRLSFSKGIKLIDQLFLIKNIPKHLPLPLSNFLLILHIFINLLEFINRNLFPQLREHLISFLQSVPDLNVLQRTFYALNSLLQ